MELDSCPSKSKSMTKIWLNLWELHIRFRLRNQEGETNWTWVKCVPRGPRSTSSINHFGKAHAGASACFLPSESPISIGIIKWDKMYSSTSIATCVLSNSKISELIFLNLSPYDGLSNQLQWQLIKEPHGLDCLTVRLWFVRFKLSSWKDWKTKFLAKDKTQCIE